MNKKQVIIIGAGPAGITAGCEILKQSDEYQVTMIEEEAQVGGISKTVCWNGNRMDLGGHRFFTKNDRVMNWWKELLPVQGEPSMDDKVLDRPCSLEENGPDPEKEDAVFLKRNRVSRIYYNHAFFDYPVKMNMTTIKNLGFAVTAEAGLSYLKSVIFKRKEKSLEDFYINRFGKTLYRLFFEDYTEKLWGRHPRDISPDWGAQRVKGLSLLAVLKDIFGKRFLGTKHTVETSLIESFYYPKYGPGQLWEAAAAQFEQMGGRILTGCRVEKIKMRDEKTIEEVIYDKDGQKNSIKADIVMSTMPVKELAAGMDYVTPEIRQITEGLPYRDYVTVGILVDKLKIKNTTTIKTFGEMIPDCWIYVQDRGVRLGRIQIFNNWSPYMVKQPQDTVWIGLEYFCAEGDEMWSMTGEEWSRFGRKELIKIGVLDAETEILDTHCEKVKKAYPAYFDTYKEMNRVQNWINSVDNLYCIGRNGQHRYNNMDHSMLTAFEAVKAILSGSADKSAIWEVNTEKEYHEEKRGD